MAIKKSKKSGAKAPPPLVLKVKRVFDGPNDDVIVVHIQGSDDCGSTNLTVSKGGSPGTRYEFKGVIEEVSAGQQIVLKPFRVKG